MESNKLQIHTGRNILTIESCTTDDAFIVSAYVNGIFIRSGSLQSAKTTDAFIDSVIAACGLRVKATFIKHQIKAFINNTNKQIHKNQYHEIQH
jgi:hypothetical protein